MFIPENRRPTLRDVAAAAQVSHMTVSRVVNGSQLVAEKTTQRVQAAMERLGYRPDPALSALAAYRSRSSDARSQSSVLAFLDCDATDYSRVVAGKPVLWAGGKWGSGKLREWLVGERADGILTINQSVCETAEELGMSVAFLNNLGCAPTTPHLELNPATIGVEGVRLLHHLVLRREFGLPVEPKRIALRGNWVSA